jgi:hypothetical protein
MLVSNVRLSGTLAWSKPRVAGQSPAPRASHSAVGEEKDTLYIFGGVYLTKALNDLWSFKTGESKIFYCHSLRGLIFECSIRFPYLG